MLLSILIPTLVSRRVLCARISSQLQAQIASCRCEAEVELLQLEDAGEQTTGAKRNALVSRARGRFVAFVDDDDEVSCDYVERVVDRLRSRPGIDCIGFRGTISFRGRHPREFTHSIRYKDYCSKGGTYYRPPYHLNPMRRDIAIRYPFADVSYSEDIDFAMRLQRDGVLREEEFIDSILYYYYSRRSYAWQVLLDRTEPIRHRFGLRAANRLRLLPVAMDRRPDAPA